MSTKIDFPALCASLNDAAVNGSQSAARAGTEIVRVTAMPTVARKRAIMRTLRAPQLAANH
jgi:hypothetical protein